ncbi:MAG: hypothetical protein AB1540_13175 [Bdellovibrionota bacterium]
MAFAAAGALRFTHPTFDRHVSSIRHFHQNIAQGNLIPSWNFEANHGFGSPEFTFRSPLVSYPLELFHAMTSSPQLSARIYVFFLLFAAAYGLFMLLSEALKYEQAFRRMGLSFLGGASLIFAPATLRALQDSRLETLLFLACLPWFVFGLVGLNKDRSKFVFLRSVAATSALWLCPPAYSLTAALLTVLFLVLSRRSLSGPFLLLGSMATGMLLASFYWIPALFEHRLVRFLPSSYAFLSIQEWAHPRNSFGVLWGVGLISGLWKWLWNARLDPYARLLLPILGLCIYLIHPASKIWFDLFRPPQAFSDALLASCILTGTWLGVWFARTLASKKAALILVPILALGYLGKSATSASLSAPAASPIPVKVSIPPSQQRQELVEVLSGRADSRCTQIKLGQIECVVLAIQTTTLQLNVFDYPGWTTVVDGTILKSNETHPSSGALQASLPPGKHKVAWKFRDTIVKTVAKIISGFALLALILLLFQDKLLKVQAASPKRRKNLDLRPFSQSP